MQPQHDCPSDCRATRPCCHAFSATVSYPSSTMHGNALQCNPSWYKHTSKAATCYARECNSASSICDLDRQQPVIAILIPSQYSARQHNENPNNVHRSARHSGDGCSGLRSSQLNHRGPASLQASRESLHCQDNQETGCWAKCSLRFGGQRTRVLTAGMGELGETPFAALPGVHQQSPRMTWGCCWGGLYGATAASSHPRTLHPNSRCHTLPLQPYLAATGLLTSVLLDF